MRTYSLAMLLAVSFAPVAAAQSTAPRARAVRVRASPDLLVSALRRRELEQRIAGCCEQFAELLVSDHVH